jgi:hypothetical protein
MQAAADRVARESICRTLMLSLLGCDTRQLELH